MKTYQTDQIRNIALLGNTGAGKTILAESMMFAGKVIERKGTIEAKSTVSDYTEIEQQNQRSIFSTVLYTEFNGHKINIIDTPGSDDFVGGVITAMRPVDMGVMVVNSQYGVEVGTEIFGRHAERLHKPIIFAVNQLDHDKANFEQTIDSLKVSFGPKVTPVQYPVNAGSDFNAIIDLISMKMYHYKGESGEYEELDIPADEMDKATEMNNALIETAAENDESLMEKFFDQGTLSETEMHQGIRIGLLSRGLFPVFCISSKRNIGTNRLLDFIINVGPSPDKMPAEKTVDGKEVKCAVNDPASLFVFKTAVEQHIGEINYFKVVSGKIT